MDQTKVCDELGNVVDAYGITTVVDAMIELCHQNSERLAATQHEVRGWRKNAKLLSTVLPELIECD